MTVSDFCQSIFCKNVVEIHLNESQISKMKSFPHIIPFMIYLVYNDDLLGVIRRGMQSSMNTIPNQVRTFQNFA